jgi:hypothetical protein
VNGRVPPHLLDRRIDPQGRELPRVPESRAMTVGIGVGSLRRSGESTQHVVGPPCPPCGTDRCSTVPRTQRAFGPNAVGHVRRVLGPNIRQCCTPLKPPTPGSRFCLGRIADRGDGVRDGEGRFGVKDPSPGRASWRLVAEPPERGNTASPKPWCRPAPGVGTSLRQCASGLLWDCASHA